MNLKISTDQTRLLCFSFFISLITYGFALTNFTLSVDSESFIYPDYSLALGRWGNNLLRYHIFNGHLPYFTMLLGLVFLSLTAVELSKLLRLGNTMSYLFCAVFLSFPQMAYHMIFNMQADSIPLGFLACALGMAAYFKSVDEMFSPKSIGYFILAALLMMFSLACYQALIVMPVVIYLMRLLQDTDQDNFSIKNEFRPGVHFIAFMVVSAAFYYLSVKLLCPPVQDGGYLASYASGDSSNRMGQFFKILQINVFGNAYYGEKLFVVVPFITLLLLVKSAMKKRALLYKIIILVLLIVIPYGIAFFITNNYYPPRLYVTSGIFLAFLIVHALKNVRMEKPVLVLSGVYILINIYFVSMLFYSGNKIFNYDKDTARKIDMTIQQQYPNFDQKTNYVYFYGGLPYENYDRLRLPDSEIFGGSLFNWDGGSNDRIINFFKFNDIAYYRMIDNKDIYLKIKDSIEPMPIWPKAGSVKMVNDVMIIRLGKEKGAKLWVE